MSDMFGWTPSGTFGEVPEEVKQIVERRTMEGEEIRHNIRRLISELDKDQLVALRDLISVASSAETSNYFTGFINANLELRYDVCGLCCVDHNEELKHGTYGSVDLASEPPKSENASSEQLELELNFPSEKQLNPKVYTLPAGAPYSCAECGVEYANEKAIKNEPNPSCWPCVNLSNQLGGQGSV